MTRQEQIKQQAKLLCNTVSPEEYFIMGAEWADQHPMTYDGKAMLYVNRRSHENGYKEAVDKACEWLYDHLYTRRDEQSPANHFVCSKQEMLTQTEFVEQFRKAMKGD